MECVGLTQRARQGTETVIIQNIKMRIYASPSGVNVTERTPSLRARTKTEKVHISWGYSSRRPKELGV
jgi:hypothetical protein